MILSDQIAFPIPINFFPIYYYYYFKNHTHIYTHWRRYKIFSRRAKRNV